MTDQKSTDAALSAAVNIFYEKKILQAFPAMTVYYNQAPLKEELPMFSGQTVEFTRYLRIAGKVTAAAEFTATQVYMSATTVSAKVVDVAEYVQLSKKANLSAIGNALEQASKLIQMRAAETVDKVIRNEIGIIVTSNQTTSSLKYYNMAIDGGTLYSTGKAVRIWSRDLAGTTGESDRFPLYHNKARLAQSSLVTSIAKSGMSIKTIQSAVNVLNGKNIPPLADGYYGLICHPTTAYQITSSVGYKGWYSQTSSAPVANNPKEVPIIGQTKIYSTTNCPRFPLSADTMYASSVALYGSLLFGADAYAVYNVETTYQQGSGFNFYLKQSGEQTTADPTNRIKTAGYDLLMAAKITNKSAGVMIITTEVV